MSWGTHPDTMCLAFARGAEERSGFADGSADALQVFRDAYEKIATPAYGTYKTSLKEMLANLDREIARRRALEDLNAHTETL